MSRVLLLDLDHTLYPSTLPTAYAVDARITLFIQQHLKMSHEESDALRQHLWKNYGTTLKGLEVLHGVDRDHYCDFIQDVEEASMPIPDPQLREWLIDAGTKIPTYLFTNARRDWADRCLDRIGISDLLGGSQILRGILDIGCMEWIGKPEAEAYKKIERHVRERHGDVQFIFADDRLDNLEQAKAHGWSTVWVRPHDAMTGNGLDKRTAEKLRQRVALDHRIVDSLTELDIDSL